MRAIFLAVGLVIVVAGCSRTVGLNNGLIYRLKNRGPVGLSSSNPYLAGNLLLSRERDESPEIRGFIDHRGAPSAIEVEKGLFSSLLMHFYYPENRQMYSLEDIEGTWIIKGPFTIEREKFQEVARITRAAGGPARLDTPRNGVEPTFSDDPVKGGSESGGPSHSDEDPFLARLEQGQPDGKPGGGFRSPAPPLSSSTAPLDPTSAELERIIKESKAATAEISPKGDIVHYVTYPGETLSLIAQWYTKERGNGERLARINQLKAPNRLEVGDVVIIPSYLVQNKKRLTEEAIRKLGMLNTQR